MQCPYCYEEMDAARANSLEELSNQDRVNALLAENEVNVDKRECPSCGKVVHFRYDASTEEGYALTSEDACALDAARLANLYLGLVADPFAAFAPEERRGGKSVAAAVWAALDAAADEALRREDWGTLSKLRLEKARYLCATGGDFFPVQKEAMAYQLLDLRKRGAARVRICAGQDGMVCEECAKHAGLVLDIDEAIEKALLPVHCNGDTRVVKLDDERHWCRCFYVRAS